jgi:non-heme chloroperoxidase
LPFEEVHPDSDFFLIFFDDSLQKGKKLFLLSGIVLRLIYVAAELPHEFDVVHAARPPGDSTIRSNTGRNTGNSVEDYYRKLSPLPKMECTINWGAREREASAGIRGLAKKTEFSKSNHTEGENVMPTITTKDGTHIYYKDWGKGQPIVFSHGWPLTADDWDGQMMYFGQRGYRVIAHDRRGHGRSTQTWDGNDMDTYADDLAALTEKLDLRNAVHVGHSTGGGEVARYIGRHGSKRVGMAVLISAVPPLMVKTDKNPAGAPMEVFDDLRAQYTKNRAQFYKDITLPFYGYNRPGAKISEGIREHWWLQGMMGGVKAGYDCIKAFSETDFTEDLKKFDVPTLILHGDDDQIVPIGAAAMQSSKLVKGATLKVYPGFPHGMPTTNADQINTDLLAFIEQNRAKAAA